MQPRKGASGWPLPLWFSLAVNVYVLIYLMYQSHPQHADGGGGSLQLETKIHHHRKLVDELPARSALAAPAIAGQPPPLAGGNASLALNSGLLFGGPGWPSLTRAGPEVWAAGTLGSNASLAAAVSAALQPQESEQLEALCGRCLHQTITKSVEVRGIGHSVFVATGDIPDEWLRDGSVQLAVYLPRLAEHPLLRQLIEGAIRTQAYFILSDPWANSFRKGWTKPESLPKFDRQIGRGGWIATRNFEVDSGAYFLNLLWNYASTPGALWGAAAFLNDTLLHDAAALMVDTWTLEQRHEERSPYRYAELPREGRGAASNYTGMIWSGFRPSDDPNTYGYNIPVNMYAAGSLERLAALNERVWRDAALGAAARRLAADIRGGIDKFGVVPVPGDAGGARMYAYEVDGLGGVLASFDDPNIPSLLSVPLLGYAHYDPAVYAATRRRILSPANSHYFQGSQLRGCGSPHTPANYVWSLAHCVQGLTSPDPAERADMFRQLLQMQGDNGLMHESNDVNDPRRLTRPLFQWANTMLVVYYEQTFGRSCSQAAEALRLKGVSEREGRETLTPRNGGPDLPAYYDRLEQSIPHV